MSWTGTCGICHLDDALCHCVLDAETQAQRGILNAAVERTNADLNPYVAVLVPGAAERRGSTFVQQIEDLPWYLA